MKRRWMIALPLLALVSLVWITTGSAVEHKKTATTVSQKVIVTPDDIQWQEGPAAIPNTKMAVLEGNPKKAGFFVARLKVPAGTKIPPHIHNNVERVTVISGKVYLAMGDKEQKPSVLPAGSYFSLPPKTVHNAWVDEETVLQITTYGPWTYKPMKTTEKRGEQTGE